MAARAGMEADAETYFRAAFSTNLPDSYLLGAYADFLLDQERFAEVTTLLREKTRADPLLLRYALALRWHCVPIVFRHSVLPLTS